MRDVSAYAADYAAQTFGEEPDRALGGRHYGG